MWLAGIFGVRKIQIFTLALLCYMLLVWSATSRLHFRRLSGSRMDKFYTTTSSTTSQFNTFTPQQIEASLLRNFGFNESRSGQIEVIQAVCSGRDSLVLWATGQGKSLCYQLPALLQRKTVLVVSPLISLMNDQVTQINHKIKSHTSFPVACFLGSAQKDAFVERDVLAGHYLLVYLTPEKLCSSGFLDALIPLFNAGKICLFAIDEAHCTSEWGNDFRPEYSKLGVFRQQFPSIPTIALTATAVDKVTSDITLSLDMRNPLISVSNLDRTNLQLKVIKKQSFDKDMRQIYTHIQSTMNSSGKIGSCIIYVPTRELAESIKHTLENMLDNVDVGFYHGSLDMNIRDATHKDFLVGTLPIVVATIAFGMGIDKPDIRSIVHYGAPSTMESYIQHIGRAGRDGYPSTCLAIVSDVDFSNYNSEFYTKNKSPIALAARNASMAFLQKYCNDMLSCRRKIILSFFNQIPSYERCGTCDNCMRLFDRKGDVSRDFTLEALFMIRPLLGGNAMSMSTLIDGAMAYMRSSPQLTETNTFTLIKGVERRKEFLKDLLPLLVNEGILIRQSKSYKVQQASKVIVYDEYSITTKGSIIARNSERIILPIPLNLMRLEEEKTADDARKLQGLIDDGIDVSNVPVEELERGGGEVLDMHIMWSRYIRNKREQGKMDVVNELEEMLVAIYEWRSETAIQLGMAPAAVIGDHIAMKLAYSRAKTEEDVAAAGVRINNTELLVARMLSVSSKYASNSTLESVEDSPLVVFPTVFQASCAWKHAVLKPMKGSNVPLWKTYSDRHSAGETLAQLAMSPTGNKPAVQTSTVLAHVLTALLFGEKVFLARLATEAEASQANSVPTVKDWETIGTSVAMGGMQLAENPNVLEYANMRNIVGSIVGASIADRESKTRTKEENDLMNSWLSKVRWYLQAQLVGVPVTF